MYPRHVLVDAGKEFFPIEGTRKRKGRKRYDVGDRRALVRKKKSTENQEAALDFSEKGGKGKQRMPSPVKERKGRQVQVTRYRAGL